MLSLSVGYIYCLSMLELDKIQYQVFVFQLKT
jgi:hypothetical protein